MFPTLVVMEEADSGAASSGDATGSRPAAAPRPTGPAPERLGDYRILREVGRGGMGVVYEAEQVSLGPARRPEGPARPDRPATPSGLERFRREARAAARLHHTNIVPVFDVGEDGGVDYYAMQFIQGQGLDEVLDELQGPATARGRDAAAGPTPPPPDGRRPLAAEVGRSLLTGRFDGEARPPPAAGTGAPRPPRPPGDGAAASGLVGGPARPVGALRGRGGPAPLLAAWPRSACRWPRRWPTPTARASSTATSSRRTCCSTPTARVWVTDFGLAKADGRRPDAHRRHRRHAPLHGPGAVPRPVRPAQRRLQPGPDPVRAADAAAGVRRRPTGWS